MLLKNLIEQLQELYDEEIKHKEIMGEPTIHIDVFTSKEGNTTYRGFSPDIIIDRSDDGVYIILSAE